MEDARAALALDPQDPAAHYTLARSLRSTGRHEEAVKALTRAIELNPSFAEAYNDIAITLQWWGKSEESYSHLERALELNPIGLAARVSTIYIGFAHLNLGRYEEAVEVLDRAIALGSDYLWLHIAKAAALAYLGRAADVEQAMTNVQRVAPQVSLRWVSEVLGPRQNQADHEHLLEGLRKAGLPEN
jgi:adenylate cyclase